MVTLEAANPFLMQKRQEKDLIILRWLQEHINTYVLFVLLSLIIFIIPIFDPEASGWLRQVILVAIYLLVVLNISRYWRFALGVALITFAVKWTGEVWERPALSALADLLSLLLFAYGVWGLIRNIVLEEQVKLEVILAAISGYLLLGLFFAVIVGVCVQNDPGAFDFQDSTPSKSDIRYFTIVTLSTLGYGDITPQTPVARSLAMFIAVCGQMYMAVIIALLVGKAGRSEREGDGE